MGDKVSLAEMFGKKAAKKDEFDLSDLKELLGEKMPDMPYNAVGKIRLINSLHQRFGEGYNNIPKVRNLIKKFDSQVEDNLTMLKIKKMKL